MFNGALQGAAAVKRKGQRDLVKTYGFLAAFCVVSAHQPPELVVDVSASVKERLAGGRAQVAFFQ